MATQIPAVWHGSQAEHVALDTAVKRNCTCSPEQQVGICSVHDALDRDQRWLDGLVFMRRHVERLLVEEFLV
jgi:hypothetical protein